ncbi:MULTISPECIES: hypothetical protein [Sorangium]|uniref:hypothetical protein n=1 Tax=Sorangium TaxID=39643 RepID=UPI003D9C183F
MASVFSRTQRALDVDNPRRVVLELALVLSLLAGWAAWLALARVAVYVSSDEARIEAGGAAPAAGAGAPRVVADFAAADALGRVRPGQAGRLQLHGFSRQRGGIPVTVERVGDEVRADRVRVELAVRPGAAPDVPLQRGLRGSVELEIGTVPPLDLLLRDLRGPAGAASAGAPPGGDGT